MSFKIRFEHFLEKNNLNATDLCRKARIPRQTVGNWLSGQAPKNIDQILRAADTLGITLNDLFYDEDRQKEQSSKFINKRFEVRIVREL